MVRKVARQMTTTWGARPDAHGDDHQGHVGQRGNVPHKLDPGLHNIAEGAVPGHQECHRHTDDKAQQESKTCGGQGAGDISPEHAPVHSHLGVRAEYFRQGRKCAAGGLTEGQQRPEEDGGDQRDQQPCPVGDLADPVRFFLLRVHDRASSIHSNLGIKCR